MRPESPSIDVAEPVSTRQLYASGDRVAGKYKLLRPLGEGGMGVLWIAHNLGLDVHVALKLIKPEADSPAANERLIREARAAARLDHPAIVRILDVGHSELGDPFLVMELLDGESLAEVLDRRKRLDAMTSVQIILPIISALAAMHAKGMVHRDVKPDNLFLAQGDAGSWQPKLLDFGIAKLEERGNNKLTRRGMVLGSAGYIAPEVMLGDEADARSDLWSLCVVLYEMMTGAHPYDASTTAREALALRVLPPEPVMSHGAGDAELWAILSRGLRTRSERWSSMPELGKALALWLWNRGETEDVTGVSLKGAWLDAGDLTSVVVSPVSSRPTLPPGELPGGPRSGSRDRSRSPTEPDLRLSQPSSSPPQSSRRSRELTIPPVAVSLFDSRPAGPADSAHPSRPVLAPVVAAPVKARKRRSSSLALGMGMLILIVVVVGLLARRRLDTPATSEAPVAPPPQASPPVQAAAPAILVPPVPTSDTPVASAATETTRAAPSAVASALPAVRVGEVPKRGDRSPRRADPAADLKDPFR